MTKKKRDQLIDGFMFNLENKKFSSERDFYVYMREELKNLIIGTEKIINIEKGNEIY